MTMCRDNDPCSYLKGQGHKLGSKVKNGYILSCPGYNSIMHRWILDIIYNNFFFGMTMCRNEQPCSQLIGQGHKLGSNLKDRNILPCPGYILSMHGWILKLFGTNVLLGKTMCQDKKTMCIALRSRSQTEVKCYKGHTFGVSGLKLHHAQMDFQIIHYTCSSWQNVVPCARPTFIP